MFTVFLVLEIYINVKYYSTTCYIEPIKQDLRQVKISPIINKIKNRQIGKVN